MVIHHEAYEKHEAITFYDELGEDLETDKEVLKKCAQICFRWMGDLEMSNKLYRAHLFVDNHPDLGNVGFAWLYHLFHRSEN